MKYATTLTTASTATLIALVLSACATKPPKEEIPDCMFPDNPTQKAPAWVCPQRSEIEGAKNVGFGSFHKSGAGYQFSLDQATARARGDLATQMKSKLTQSIASSVSTTGAGATGAVEEAASSATSQITSQTLVGSKVVRSAQDALGNVYVLVGMDIEASNRVMQQALQTAMQSSPAVWQKVQGNRTPDQMQAEILKMNDH